MRACSRCGAVAVREERQRRPHLHTGSVGTTQCVRVPLQKPHISSIFTAETRPDEVMSGAMVLADFQKAPSKSLLPYGDAWQSAEAPISRFSSYLTARGSDVLQVCPFSRTDMARRRRSGQVCLVPMARIAATCAPAPTLPWCLCVF
jgi:hypothetical protein